MKENEPMVLLKRILILEDNLDVLSRLLKKLASIEENQPYDLSLMVLTDYEQVESFVNPNPSAKFDIILMDRDCKLNRSFHVLDVERFGAEKVIAMSSVPEYNQELKKRGVKRLVEKNFAHIDEFVDKIGKNVEEMLRKMPLSGDVI